MRVLFDYQAFSIQSRGGISRYVLELGSRLASREGIEPRLFAGWHRNLLLQEAAPVWTQGKYVPPWTKTGPLRHLLNRYLMGREVRRWRPNIVHETYFRNGPAYQSDIPTVLTIYDLIYFILPTVDGSAARVRKAQRAAIARAAHIICISENTRQDLLRLLAIDPQHISVISLGGPPSLLPGSPLPARPAISGPYFLHVGPRHSYKNFDLILRALAGAPHLHSNFQLVAFGDQPFTADEISRMRELGLNPARIVHRTGNDSALESYYAHAAAYLCPSLYEGFGLPALEAMTRRCPVVCSNRGSLPEVTGGAAITFDPTAPGELADALTRLTESPDLLSELRARGLKQAARFSWERCADETLAVYRRLAK